ncbi:MAG: efflux RND transporter periplasmic adaptor subunit [Pseudomonadota bacterium]
MKLQRALYGLSELRRSWRILCVASCVPLASACDQILVVGTATEAAATCAPDEICGLAGADRVRAIKPYVVTQLASGAERRFSGEIEAANAAPLSFPVGGTVTSIDVSAGDAVEKNALLATLDDAPFDINVQSARADLSAAQAAERAMRTELQRQRELRENDWVSQAALDQAEVEYENARSQASVAQSRLTLAERDLASTRMTAPFDGVISSVSVERFTEVRPGQTITVVQSADAFEVVVSVPEIAVGAVTPGSPVAIDVATLPLCGCRGYVVEVGAVSSAGNAVDIVVAVTEAPAGLRSGMSAEAAISLGGTERASGYFIPLSAIAPGADDQSAVVFRFDRAEGVVRRTPVRFIGSVASEAVAVEGLEAGDIIAAAGVSFLSDGQRVRLLGQGE